MLRSTLSRLLSLALLSTGVLAAAAPPPAQAAAGDVLSMEWQTVSYRGPVLSQSASFTAYATGAYAGGATATVPGTFNSVWLAPPTGVRFEAGATYDAAYARTTARGLLRFNNFAFSRTECSSTSSAPYTGTLFVHSASYDADGALTDLAADYSATCSPATGASETVAGSVRHLGTQPWLTVQPSTTKDVVAIGREHTTSVTLAGTGSGKSVRLGDASLTGLRAQDYRIASDGCTGIDLGPAATCTVAVTFAPQVSSSAAPDRVARLSVPASGHVLSTVELGLASRAVTPPSAPVLKSFPTAAGVGLLWAQGSTDEADSFRVERRAPGGSWTTLQQVAASAPLRYVDPDVAAGESATYRVVGSVSGWDGEATSVAATRPATVPAVGASSTVSYGDDDSATPWRTIASATATRFDLYGGGAPSLYAEQAPASLSWQVPVLPGPGEYTDAAAGGASLGSVECPGAQRVLEVRSVLYDQDAKPVVLDGSWVERCDGTSTPRRMEVRIGVAGTGARVSATPTHVGPLTGYGESTATRDVVIGNGGPGAVSLSSPRIDGVGAADWSVQGSTCTTPVPAGGSCTLTVRFATTTQGSRPATLSVQRSDATGPLAPAYVPLDGTGGTSPGAVTRGSTLGTADAVVIWWDAADGHGLEVDDYLVQRQQVGQTDWRTLTNTLGDRVYTDRTAEAGASYRYRVSAGNRAGYGPVTVVGEVAAPDRERGLVVAGAQAANLPSGLFQVVPERPDAPATRLTTDGQDYFSPALSPAGSRLAFSRSVPGAQDEYDLWSGTVAEPLQRRLTSMSGVETDPAYSPDATQIAFTRMDAQGQSSVWVVAALGGTPRRLRVDASAPTWTPDGRSVVVQDDTAVAAPLLSLDPVTAAATPLPGTTGGYDPTISRAGRLAWVSEDGRVLALDQGATTPVVVLEAPAGGFYSGLVFDDRGTLLYDRFSLTTFLPVTHHTDALAISFDPAPLRSDRTSPVVSVEGPGAVVHGSADVTVAVGDHDETPSSVLRPRCLLDAVVQAACGGPTSLVGLGEGSHVLTVEVSDESGHRTTLDRSFVSDTVAPSLALTSPTQASVNQGAGNFTWAGRTRPAG